MYFAIMYLQINVHYLLTTSYILSFRVVVTGIYRATPIRVNPRQRNVKAVYKTYIDVIHYKKTDKKKLYTNDPDR